MEDFDDLVDPRTLAFYCLGPDLSTFVLRTLDIEKKRVSVNCLPLAGMTTKFNQSMYARMRAKKNVPLSNLGAKTVRVMDKGAFVTPATSVTPGTETTRTASLATLVKEILPQQKRQRKDKVVTSLSSVWDDARVAMAKAQETFIAEEMKMFSGLSANELVGRHLHKLVQGRNPLMACLANF
ncbi:hypothetical protein SO802_006764 [Lithocarpus litseifolius]|uniref:Uncharacterized protein n=1 Tax=Lithocarpus litseifolius TaxID=425828 RepID=A0AAW2DRP7_9ROSI